MAEKKDAYKKMYSDKIGACAFGDEQIEKGKDGGFDVPAEYVDVAQAHGLSFDKPQAKKE